MSEQERGVAEAQAALEKRRHRAIEETLAGIGRSSNLGKAAFAAVLAFKYMYITAQTLIHFSIGTAQRLLAAWKRFESAWSSSRTSQSGEALEGDLSNSPYIADRIVSLAQKRGRLVLAVIVITTVVVISDIYDEYVQPTERPFDPTIEHSFRVHNLHAAPP